MFSAYPLLPGGIPKNCRYYIGSAIGLANLLLPLGIVEGVDFVSARAPHATFSSAGLLVLVFVVALHVVSICVDSLNALKSTLGGD